MTLTDMEGLVMKVTMTDHCNQGNMIRRQSMNEARLLRYVHAS